MNILWMCIWQKVCLKRTIRKMIGRNICEPRQQHILYSTFPLNCQNQTENYVKIVLLLKHFFEFLFRVYEMLESECASEWLWSRNTADFYFLKVKFHHIVILKVYVNTCSSIYSKNKPNWRNTHTTHKLNSSRVYSGINGSSFLTASNRCYVYVFVVNTKNHCSLCWNGKWQHINKKGMNKRRNMQLMRWENGHSFTLMLWIILIASLWII